MSPLLDLAPELRLRIYEAFFDLVVTETPRYPWSPALPHSRFCSILSLILLNRQVHKEATAHFQLHYTSKVTFYFDSIYKLHKFTKESCYHQSLPNARFNLRDGSHMLGNSSSGLGNFILEQPWAGLEWHRLNWFNDNGFTFGTQALGAAPRHCSKHELEAKGFRLSREPTPQAIDKVDFPISEPWRETIRLTFWAPQPGWQPGPENPAQDSTINLSMGCLELEAGLDDADFSKWSARRSARL